MYLHIYLYIPISIVYNIRGVSLSGQESCRTCRGTKTTWNYLAMHGPKCRSCKLWFKETEKRSSNTWDRKYFTESLYYGKCSNLQPEFIRQVWQQHRMGFFTVWRLFACRKWRLPARSLFTWLSIQNHLSQDCKHRCEACLTTSSRNFENYQ